jgi:hypothetical protein
VSRRLERRPGGRGLVAKPPIQPHELGAVIRKLSERPLNPRDLFLASIPHACRHRSASVMALSHNHACGLQESYERIPA